MKKLEKIKTIQLIVFIILAALCFLLIAGRRSVYTALSADPNLRVVPILTWIIMAVSFFFLFVDFAMYRRIEKQESQLQDAVHSDPNAHIANRLSLDEMIESYLDKPLPANFASVMFALTDIAVINEKYGHLKGNQTIKRFANILRLASVDHCFVGRNGGNQFLALFENGSEEAIQSFLDRVQEQTEAYNKENPDTPITYRYGIAVNNGDADQDIISLISASARRSADPQTTAEKAQKAA